MWGGGFPTQKNTSRHPHLNGENPVSAIVCSHPSFLQRTGQVEGVVGFAGGRCRGELGSAGQRERQAVGRRSRPQAWGRSRLTVFCPEMRWVDAGLTPTPCFRRHGEPEAFFVATIRAGGGGGGLYLRNWQLLQP